MSASATAKRRTCRRVKRRLHAQLVELGDLYNGTRHALDVLLPVGRMYLDAFEDDQLLTLAEAYEYGRVKMVVDEFGPEMGCA